MKNKYLQVYNRNFQNPHPVGTIEWGELAKLRLTALDSLIDEIFAEAIEELDENEDVWEIQRLEDCDVRTLDKEFPDLYIKYKELDNEYIQLYRLLENNPERYWTTPDQEYTHAELEDAGQFVFDLDNAQPILKL